MRLAAVVLGAILCGIDGLMMTGPFGCIAGGVAGWWVSGRRPPPA